MTRKEIDGNCSMLERVTQEEDCDEDAEKTSSKRSTPRCRSLFGLACALMSAFFFAASSMMVKLLQEAEADQLQFVRACLQYMLLVPLITYRRENIITSNRLTNCFLLARGIIGTISGLTAVFSIYYLPLGDAVSIQYIYVTLVGIFAFFCLKEPCGIFNMVVTLTTLCGLIFLTQPQFLFDTIEDGVNSADRTVGVIFALCSAVLTALVYILVRKMGSNIHYSLSLFYFASEGMIILPVFMAFRGTLRIPCLSDILVMLASGSLAFLAQILMTVALQNERAGPVTLVHTFQIIFAFLFQVIFLGSPVSLYSGIGAVLIFLSSTALVLRNMRKKKISDQYE